MKKKVVIISLKFEENLNKLLNNEQNISFIKINEHKCYNSHRIKSKEANDNVKTEEDIYKLASQLINY